MSAVPIIPDSAPFTGSQRAWLNGFIAGLLSKGSAGTLPSANEFQSQQTLIIAYGSQSGNAEMLAKKVAKSASTKGIAAKALGLEELTVEKLKEPTNLMLITSTWGEGEMPDNAAEFWNALNQKGQSLDLSKVQFSVLALGDSNYGDTFCKAGKDFDQRLEELGAKRVHTRVDCDVDFDEPADLWCEGVFKALLNAPSMPTTTSSADVFPGVREEAGIMGYHKKNPFKAKLLQNRSLNQVGSAKDTRHIVFSLDGSDLKYETGDALGVYVRNCSEVVEDIISNLGLDPEAMVASPDGTSVSLRVALTEHYEVRSWYGKKLEKPISEIEFVESLKKLQPRLYSIASSQKAYPTEVHLCVGVVKYSSDGVSHKGVASTFLAERCELGETTGIFVHTAKHFRVPADGTKPVIMIGPGTGIAPFRAFLQERKASGATGKNWLFFGDQFEATDFLYREEILDWQKEGLLTRLSLAFSRDQAEKIYVQSRMLEAADELWEWLEEGAYFYVCGDASRMAKDVDAALHQVIQIAGSKSSEEAVAYVQEMKKTKRYCRDVY